MKCAAAICAGLPGLAAAAVLSGSVPIGARDFGIVGQTFPVIEPDLLSLIESRLRRAEASGELDRTNKMFAARVESRVKHPSPVAGLSVALESRNWVFDPTIALTHDVRDQKSNLIAAAGQRINPMDFVAVRQELVFIDGGDPAQLEWATQKFTDAGAKIIFVAGSPFEQMTVRHRRFYFDQEGKLTSKFGIEHLPAVVSAGNRVMKVSEIALPQGKER